MMARRGMNTCAGNELIGMNGRAAGPKSILKCIASSRRWYENDDPNKPHSGFGRSFYVMSYAWDTPSRPDDYRTWHRPAKSADKINRWKKYVEKYDLGTVVIAPDNANPVHSMHTTVRSAIYTPNHANLWRHLIENRIPEFETGRLHW